MTGINLPVENLWLDMVIPIERRIDRQIAISIVVSVFSWPYDILLSGMLFFFT